MKKIIVIVLAFLMILTVVISSGCGGQGVSEDMSYDQLIAELREAGALIVANGDIDDSVMSVPGKSIRVNGGDVQVYEFTDAEAVEQQAAQISDDGSTIGTTMITWIGPPHFYRGGKIIVVYAGERQKVIEFLVNIFGEQFAGR